jgi:hypothetical protein
MSLDKLASVGPAQPGAAESETLLNAALPFAQKMLRDHGDFYPYAYTLKPDGTIATVAQAPRISLRNEMSNNRFGRSRDAELE